MAIREGMRPMQTFFDSNKDNLPFFGNEMAPNCHNYHHTTFSAAHIPGRWLCALLHAEEVTGIQVDPHAVENLRKWAFETQTLTFNSLKNNEIKTEKEKISNFIKQNTWEYAKILLYYLSSKK